MARTLTTEAVKLKLTKEPIGSEVSEIEDDEDSDVKVKKILSSFKSDRKCLDYLPPTPTRQSPTKSCSRSPSPKKGKNQAGLRQPNLITDEINVDTSDEASGADSDDATVEKMLSSVKLLDNAPRSRLSSSSLSSSPSCSPQKSRQPRLVAVSNTEPLPTKVTPPQTSLSNINYNPIWDILEFDQESPSPSKSLSSPGPSSRLSGKTKKNDAASKKSKPKVTFAGISKKKSTTKEFDFESFCANLGFKLDEDEQQEINEAEDPGPSQPRVDNVIEDILEKATGIKRHRVTRKVISKEQDKYENEYKKLMRRGPIPLDINEDGRLHGLNGDIVTVKDTLEKVTALISVLEKTRDKLVNNDKNLVYSAPPIRIKKKLNLKLTPEEYGNL